MADFKQAQIWMRERKQVHRKSWENELFRIKMRDDGVILFSNSNSFDYTSVWFLRINERLDSEATDWEIYEDEPTFCLTDKIIKTKEITKINPHENLFNFGWVHDEEIKECFKKIKGDFVKGKQYNWVEIENIINKRIGPELI